MSTENTIANNRSPLRRSTFGILSVTAAAALALAACAPDEELPNDGEEITPGQEEDSPEAEQTDDAADETAEEPAEDTTDDQTAEDEPTEEDAEQPEAGGDHQVYQAIETVLAEYPDGVITEFEDNTAEDGYVEVFVYDGTTEWELEVDSETFDIIDTEDDGIDDDDEQMAQAVEIEIAEALQTAEAESGGEPKDGELDTEDGTVVWEFEMTNDVEVYVDVATGEVVRVS
ncbi:PepSY domain-containing protein [Nesterenkonia ebinurensis]|uniref:PepSY domain-containing protein n=1 Tax=Nesterenkonia ebinurensis TaxID=2608252 RepID=UPI00168ADB58|nr:PepSY domain-containing protein [Nesterenkonia ebinurensis]